MGLENAQDLCVSLHQDGTTFLSRGLRPLLANDALAGDSTKAGGYPLVEPVV